MDLGLPGHLQLGQGGQEVSEKCLAPGDQRCFQELDVAML